MLPKMASGLGHAAGRRPPTNAKAIRSHLSITFDHQNQDKTVSKVVRTDMKMKKWSEPIERYAKDRGLMIRLGLTGGQRTLVPYISPSGSASSSRRTPSGSLK